MALVQGFPSSSGLSFNFTLKKFLEARIQEIAIAIEYQWNGIIERNGIQRYAIFFMKRQEQRERIAVKCAALDLKSIRKTPQRNSNNITQAPTYYPSATEFQDPMRYIASIRSEAELYGLAKIVPPKSWKPPFSIDTTTFSFETRLQHLNMLDASSRVVNNYVSRLSKFHHRNGTPLLHIPTVDKKPVNFLTLKNKVKHHGGYENVLHGNLWSRIAIELGISRANSSAASILKNLYEKWILPFETFLAEYEKNKSNDMMKSEYDSHKFDMVETDDDIKEKSKIRTGRVLIDDEESDKDQSSNLSEKRKSRSKPDTKSSVPKLSYYEPQDFNLVCNVCNENGVHFPVVMCNDCDEYYHLKCVKLDKLPKQWFCEKCVANSDEYGFEEGKLRTLPEFQKISDEFKKNWFKKDIVYEDECEKEFWRIVESPFENVTVEYGADLHSSDHGSGFPKGDDEYGKSGWNLNNMPALQGSLLRYIDRDISGMMVPWVYVGMLFSAFCWHAEDHFTYSINYLHLGETKTWYGIPASDADKFEKLMRETFPDLFETSPDLLFHITTIISPHVLKKNNIKVCTINHHPGEFVITFPRSYHAGFNQGFNIAEAVNFALPDWLPFGDQCVSLYKLYSKQPVFSHDELVVQISQTSLDFSTAKWVLQALKRLIEREKSLRLKLENIPVKFQMQRKSFSCVRCNSFCFMSYISPSVYCLDCLKYCPEPTLVICIAIESLDLLKQHIENTFQTQLGWSLHADKLMKNGTLQEMIEHVKSAKNPQDALELSKHINMCKEWITKSTLLLPKRGRKITIDKIKEHLDLCCFFGPERQRLETHFHQVQNLIERCKKEIQNENIFAFPSLMDEADRSSVTFKEYNYMATHAGRKKWIISVSQQLRYPTIEHLERLMKEADILFIEEDDPYLLRLKEQYQETKNWLNRAEKAYREKDLDEMQELIQYDYPMKIRNQMNSLVKSTLEWLEKADFGDADSSNKKLVSLVDINDMINKSSKLAIPKRTLDSFLHKVDPLYKAHERLHTLFTSDNLYDNLCQIHNQIKTCINNSSNSQCFCRTTDNTRLMIQCTNCNQWYHILCINVAKAEDQFICPICKNLDAPGPKLSQILPLYSYINRSPIITPETKKLIDIVELILYFLEQDMNPKLAYGFGICVTN